MSIEDNPWGPLPDVEQLVASAARFLVDGGELDAARILVSCNIELVWDDDHPDEGQFGAILTGPRAIYDQLRTRGNREETQIRNALNAVTPMNRSCRYIGTRAEALSPSEIDPDWRRQIAEVVGGKHIHNQGQPIGTAPLFEWQYLRFRSEAERRIAIALEQTRVLFFPNCMGRITTETGKRANREPDFLICDGGKWGILEIDGAAYHHVAATDHRRDRGFRAYGIRVERFTATECFEDAPSVVQRFLRQLNAP